MGLVNYSVSGRVAKIVLDHPPANAFSPQLGKELLDALHRSQDDRKVRIRLIAGEGNLFCGGFDFTSVTNPENLGPIRTLIRGVLNPVMMELLRTDAKVTVCAVNGPAAGAGAGIALAADIVFMSDDAKFVFPFISTLGITPGCLTSYTLPRLVGQQKALELFLSGAIISADSAMELGLTSPSHPKDKIHTHAFGVASKLANGPSDLLKTLERLRMLPVQVSSITVPANNANPELVAATVELVTKSLGNSPEQQADLEATYLERFIEGPIFRGVIRSYLEKNAARCG